MFSCATRWGRGPLPNDESFTEEKGLKQWLGLND